MADTLLSVQSLVKRFGAVQASNDFSLNVARGELHALIGPNGAGKTTVLNQLSGDLVPDGGEIYFDGRRMTHLPAHQRARLGLGRSYQITAVFDHLTVKENLSLAIQAHHGHSFRFWRKAGDDPAIRQAIGPAMERVGLEERASLPAANLSHGEKRQLEVGMALAGQPKMLLLDEPDTGLDQHLGQGGHRRGRPHVVAGSHRWSAGPFDLEEVLETVDDRGHGIWINKIRRSDLHRFGTDNQEFKGIL